MRFDTYEEYLIKILNSLLHQHMIKIRNEIAGHVDNSTIIKQERKMLQSRANHYDHTNYICYPYGNPVIWHDVIITWKIGNQTCGYYSDSRPKRFSIRYKASC